MLRSFFFCALLLLSSTSQAQVTVLTSIKPLQFIAEAITQGQATTEVLLPPGASPHHYALRPSDITRIEQADLVYWIGNDLETFLAKPLARRKLPTVAIQKLPTIQLLHFSTEHDAHDEHDHDHAPGSIDTHLWLSTQNALIIAEKMANDLAKLDPNNATLYQANLTQFKQALAQTNTHIKQQLGNTKQKPFFVFHEAFNYFEQAYGLKHAGVFAISAEIQPGARHVQKMRQQLAAAGASCVFTEPPLQPRLASTLSADLPVTLVELDPLGTHLISSPSAYPQLLENLAKNISQCLNQE